MNILYLGNNLSQTTGYYGTMDAISDILKMNEFKLKIYSDKKNQLLRFLDLVFHLFYLSRWTDIVIIEVFSTKAFNFAWVLGILSKALRLPYICVLHGGDLPKRYKRSPKRVSQLFSNALVCVAPSKYLFNEFEMDFNIVRIPNSIILKNYPVREKEYSKINLLFVRAIADIYNPKMAIDVLKNLRRKGFDVSLTMVGPDRDGTLVQLKEYTELHGMSLFVEFTGVLSKSEWINRSKDSNIFINTTNIDNSPVSVVEAMALGFPVVSTNVGGIPFLIENGINGLLVESNDDVGMSDAIIEIYNNQDLRDDLIKNSRETVLELDQQKVLLTWKELIDGLS
ncbi:glycosyltransferase family 4 protein [Flavobacteriaceae bacterium]|nr:glycosyltransferase family 4 protein [Flavobacteriaceae bacterium]